VAVWGAYKIRLVDKSPPRHEEADDGRMVSTRARHMERCVATLSKQEMTRKVEGDEP
jgi:hypothetical protein